jgi:hypothetical protein
MTTTTANIATKLATGSESAHIYLYNQYFDATIGRHVEDALHIYPDGYAVFLPAVGAGWARATAEVKKLFRKPVYTRSVGTLVPQLATDAEYIAEKQAEAVRSDLYTVYSVVYTSNHDLSIDPARNVHISAKFGNYGNTIVEAYGEHSEAAWKALDGALKDLGGDSSRIDQLCNVEADEQYNEQGCTIYKWVGYER